MLPSETSSKKLFDGPTCRLAIETTSRRFERMIWFLTVEGFFLELVDPVELGSLGSRRVDGLTKLDGPGT